MVIIVSQLILMVEQLYMLSKLFHVPGREPEFIEFFQIIAQHTSVILLFCLLLWFLQKEVWEPKSYKQIASFYLIQVTIYLTVPWFTAAETIQSFTAQVLQQ